MCSHAVVLAMIQTTQISLAHYTTLSQMPTMSEKKASPPPLSIFPPAVPYDRFDMEDDEATAAAEMEDSKCRLEAGYTTRRDRKKSSEEFHYHDNEEEEESYVSPSNKKECKMESLLSRLGRLEAYHQEQVSLLKHEISKLVVGDQDECVSFLGKRNTGGDDEKHSSASGTHLLDEGDDDDNSGHGSAAKRPATSHDLFDQDNDEEKDTAEQTLPEDTFSFLIVTRAFSTPFNAAVGVFLTQMTVFSLMLWDITSPERSSGLPKWFC